MRKLLTFLIALGAIALVSLSAPNSVRAGCIIGGGIICASAPPTVPFSITAVSNGNSTTATGTYTFTSQNIGSADPSRISCVGIAAQAGSGVVVSSVTIGGTSAAQVSGAPSTGGASGSLTDIWCLAVPTGSTATIVVTMSVPITRLAIEVYSILGTSSAVSTGAHNLSSSGTTLVQSATIPSGGGAIAVFYLHTASPGTITPTNLTNDANVVFGSSTMQTGHNVTSAGSTSMGQSWTASTDSALSIATFSP
jgi:hypothetical protein